MENIYPLLMEMRLNQLKCNHRFIKKKNTKKANYDRKNKSNIVAEKIDSQERNEYFEGNKKWMFFIYVRQLKI